MPGISNYIVALVLPDTMKTHRSPGCHHKQMLHVANQNHLQSINYFRFKAHFKNIFSKDPLIQKGVITNSILNWNFVTTKEALFSRSRALQNFVVGSITHDYK